MSARGPLGLLLAAALLACDAVGPSVGSERDLGAEGAGGLADDGTCTLADSDPDTPTPWSEVKGRLLEKRCGCHMTPSGFGATVGGLLLARVDSALKGGRHGDSAIVPGDPCASFVVQKTGGHPPFGARMPLQSKPLDADERQLLIDWIAEGALP